MKLTWTYENNCYGHLNQQARKEDINEHNWLTILQVFAETKVQYTDVF